MKTFFFAAIFALATLAGQQARADEPTVAPFAGHCFGDGTSTCLVPELTFDVTRVRLDGPDAGKMEVGAVPIGAGYALLFGYDQWWASGPSVHGVFNLSQADSNFVQITGMVTAARYVHAGVVWARMDGANAWWLAAGLTLPVDVVTTAVAGRKAEAVRAAQAAQP